MAHLTGPGNAKNKRGKRKKGSRRGDVEDGTEKQLGCQIKWECNGEKLVFPLCSDGGEAASSASNFHTSISAQLRSTLPNQSSRKYP